MTLLEIVVTVAILAALVVMIVGIFQSAVHTGEAARDQVGMIDRAYGAMDLLVRDLHSAHVYDSRAYFLAESQQVGGGRGTSIAFPTATPVRVSEHLRERPGLIEIAYLIGENPKAPGTLWLFRRELEPEINLAATSIRTRPDGLVLLADGLKEFRMEFLSQDTPLTPEGLRAEDWLEAWDGGFGQEKMPAAVHITMVVLNRPGSAATMTLERTVRLPVSDLAKETHDALMKESLGL